MPPQDDPTAPGGRRPAPPAKRPAPRAPVPEPNLDDEATQPRGGRSAETTAPAGRPSPAPRAPQPRAPTPAAARQVPAPGSRASRRQPMAEAGPADQTKRWSVLPDEPGRVPTMAQKLVGGATRSWGMTAAAVGGAVFLGVFGMWLVGQDHPVFGVIVMGAIIPATFMALFVRKAPCPSCGTSITVIGIDRCGKCASYVRLEGQQTVVVEDGFIAPLATFEIDIPLPIIPRLVWPDEGHCVVCGERTARIEELDIQGTRLPVPHCGDCEDGVTWNIGISATAVGVVKLKFRSFSYWKGFVAINEVHTRQGMWR